MDGATVWLDGDLVPWKAAQTSVLSHGIQRGSLVFDVGALRPGQRGPLLFRPREHIARFLRSAELVGLTVGWGLSALLGATKEVVLARGVDSGLVRWSAWVPSVEPDVVPRGDSRASVAIAVITPGDTNSPGIASPSRPATARVMVPDDLRKAGPEVFPPQAKVAAAYLGPMLAKRRALESGFDEVVLLDGEGYVAEAPTSNVFFVRDGALVTPPIDRVLAGITRDSVLAVAQAEGLETREERFTLEDLKRADEAFLVSTSLPLLPIASVNGGLLGAKAPGPVTTRIRELIAACERGNDPRFVDWVEALT
jgi:branched-chain amino acid aminotransferase